MRLEKFKDCKNFFKGKNPDFIGLFWFLRLLAQFFALDFPPKLGAKCGIMMALGKIVLIQLEASDLV